MLCVHKSGGVLQCILILLLILGVSSFGCGEDEPQASQNTPDRPLLNCEKYNYPCSLNETHLDRYRESIELGDEVYERFMGGTSKEEIVNWLENMEQIEAVYYSDIGVGFRLEGTRAVHVAFESPMITSSENLFSSELQLDHMRREIPTLPMSEDFNKRVVGQQREEPEPKHALVLSPYEFDFGDFPSGIDGYDSGDEGEWVRDFLIGSMRGYNAGTVSYIENDGVSLDAYKGWGSYDLVHVATHGNYSCWEDEETGDSVCGLELYSGIELDDVLDLPTIPGYKNKVGLDTLKLGGKWWVVLDVDFFSENYSGGLQNTFVFLNACYSGAYDDEREESEFFPSLVGWTERISSQYASRSAATFYTIAHEYGYSVGEIMKRMRSLSSEGQDLVEFTTPEGDLSMFVPVGSSTFRIREVVTFEREAGQPYLPGDSLSFVPGTEDEPPKTILHAKIEGLKESEGDVTVSFYADGAYLASDNVFNPQDAEVIALENDAYQMIIEVPLDSHGPDIDVSEYVVLEVQARLPHGGLSRHKVPNILYPGNRVNAAFNVNGSLSAAAAGYKHGFAAIVDTGATLSLTIHDSEQITEGSQSYALTLMRMTTEGIGAIPSGTYSIGAPGVADFHPVFTDVSTGIEYSEFDDVSGVLVVGESSEEGWVAGTFSFESFRYDMSNMERTGEMISVTDGVFYAETSN